MSAICRAPPPRRDGQLKSASSGGAHSGSAVSLGVIGKDAVYHSSHQQRDNWQSGHRQVIARHQVYRDSRRYTSYRRSRTASTPWSTTGPHRCTCCRSEHRARVRQRVAVDVLADQDVVWLARPGRNERRLKLSLCEPVERRMMTLNRKREIVDRPHDRGQWFRHAAYGAIGGGLYSTAASFPMSIGPSVPTASPRSAPPSAA